MNKIVRKLSWFKKNGDTIVGEAVLRNARLSTLRRAFKARENDTMYDEYGVGEAQRELVERLSGVSIDLNRYDYFIGAERVTRTTVTGKHSSPAAGGSAGIGRAIKPASLVSAK